MTCNAFIVSYRDVLDDALIYQAWCRVHQWEGDPTANDTVARAQVHKHKAQQQDGETT